MKRKDGFYETTLRMSIERNLRRQFEEDSERVGEEFNKAVAGISSKKHLEEFNKRAEEIESEQLVMKFEEDALLVGETSGDVNETIDNFDKDPFESGLT